MGLGVGKRGGEGVWARGGGEGVWTRGGGTDLKGWMAYIRG